MWCMNSLKWYECRSRSIRFQSVFCFREMKGQSFKLCFLRERSHSPRQRTKRRVAVQECTTRHSSSLIGQCFTVASPKRPNPLPKQDQPAATANTDHGKKTTFRARTRVPTPDNRNCGRRISINCLPPSCGRSLTVPRYKMLVPSSCCRLLTGRTSSRSGKPPTTYVQVNHVCACADSVFMCVDGTLVSCETLPNSRVTESTQVTKGIKQRNHMILSRIRLTSRLELDAARRTSATPANQLPRLCGDLPSDAPALPPYHRNLRLGRSKTRLVGSRPSRPVLEKGEVSA